MRGDDPTTLSGARYPDPEALGRYRVDARIATGRYTIAYRCTDTADDRAVCVKLLASPWDESEEEVRRFLERGRALVGFTHAHVPEVLHLGREGKRPFFAMELAEGEDLARTLGKRRTLPLTTALRALRETALALDAALARGLLHGDVRPRHLIASPGGVQVVGFSLSPPWTTAHGRELSGDAAYAAPEIVDGRAPDHRTDIYALGCTGYELLTGRTPFGVGAPDALLACHVHEPFPRVSARCPGTPPGVDALLLRMAAKNPNARPQTYGEIVRAFEDLERAVLAGGPSEPLLVVEAGRQRGLSVEIPEGELLLGRSPDEGFALDDARVSRRHAVVRRRGTVVEITDLGSRNGVVVNGQRVASARLSQGDRVQLGDTLLVAVLPDDADAPEVLAPPSLGPLPASPVRGAFGEAEVARPPAQQLTAEGLASCDDPAAAKVRLRVLASIARLLTEGGEPAAVRARAVEALRGALLADGGLWVTVDDGAPVLEAKSGEEAALLSCALPAVERALPGHLSLSSTVKVGRDGAWGVALAPVRPSEERVTGFVVLVSHGGRFDEDALAALEGACALLSAHERGSSS